MVLSKKDVPEIARKENTHPLLQKFEKFPNAPNPAKLSQDRSFLTKNIGENFVGGKKLKNF